MRSATPRRPSRVHADHLDAVAGADHGRLVDALERAQLAVHVVDLLVGERHRFAHVDRRGAVVEADDEHLVLHQPNDLPCGRPRLRLKNDTISSAKPTMVSVAARRPRQPTERVCSSTA